MTNVEQSKAHRASHRDLIGEVLAPLGFRLFIAGDGTECLRIAEQFRPDLVLLDVSMPGLDGWQVARALRRAFGHELPIIMISANADERHKDDRLGSLHNAYLTKPIDIGLLLEQIRQSLQLEWIYETPDPAAAPAPPPRIAVGLPEELRAELRHLGQIGHITGIRTRLDDIQRNHPEHGIFVEHMRILANNFDLSRFLGALEESSRDDR